MRHTRAGAVTRDALAMALTDRRRGPSVLYHSDRESQDAARDCQALLTAHGMTCSISRVGDGRDNAVTESLFALQNRELADHAD